MDKLSYLFELDAKITGFQAAVQKMQAAKPVMDAYSGHRDHPDRRIVIAGIGAS